LTLYILVIIGALNQSMHTGGRVAVALTAVGLAASPFTIGTIAALYGLVPMFLSVILGKLIDRIGSRVPMMVGSLLFVAGGLLPAFGPSMWKLYVAATLIGVGNMTFQLSIQNAVGRISERADLTRNFSTLAIGMSSGAIIGPLVAGYAIDYTGYESAFIFLSLLPFAALLTLIFGRVRFPASASRAVARAKTRTLDLLGHPGLLAIYIIAGLHVLSWELFSFLTPIYGSDIGLSASTIGIIMGAFSAASFAMRMLLPPLAARYNHWILIKGMLVIAAVAFLLLPLAHHTIFLVVLSSIVGAGLGAAQPLTMTLIHDNSPPDRIGESLGVRTTVVCCFQFAMPLAIGSLATVLGLAQVFWVMAVVVIAGTVATRTPATRASKKGDGASAHH
jgi:MFS family permease